MTMLSQRLFSARPLPSPSSSPVSRPAGKSHPQCSAYLAPALPALVQAISGAPPDPGGSSPAARLRTPRLRPPTSPARIGGSRVIPAARGGGDGRRPQATDAQEIAAATHALVTVTGRQMREEASAQLSVISECRSPAEPLLNMSVFPPVVKKKKRERAS